MQALQLSSRATFAVGRPSSARASRGQQQRLRVQAATLTADQQAFLERKRRESSASPSAAPTRGRSAVPRRAPSARPTSRPSAPAPSSFSAPAPAAANGLTADQQEFLERKRRETSASPAPQSTRGRSAVPRRAPSARPTSRAPSAPAPASYSPPAAANGLTPEQRAFLERKASETRGSSAPAPTRGRSNAPARASRTPSSRPTSHAAPAASSFSAPAPAAAAGLSAEQQEFLRRRASEPRALSPAPTRGRSATPARTTRPSSRPSSHALGNSSSNSSMDSWSSPAPAAANGLTPEQRAFLERKATETRGASVAAPTRGRSAPRPRR